MSRYALADSGPLATLHHEVLALLWDDTTRPLINKAVKLPGAACLDLGSGGGSVAAWLASEVGNTGLVLAVDRVLQPGFPIRSTLHHEVHEMTARAPLPSKWMRHTWDLVHARLALVHMEGRDEIATALAGRLKPGGVLLITELVPDGRVLRAPSDEDRDLVHRILVGVADSFVASGTDRGWSLRAAAVLADAGLEVSGARYGRMWRGGSHGAGFVAGTVLQLQSDLLEREFTPAQIDRALELFMDPDFLMSGHLMSSTWGTKR